MVFSGLVTAWRLATWPTRRSPVGVNATTEGVVRAPSGLAISLGESPSITATTELVVPRSIPMILLKESLPSPQGYKVESLSVNLAASGTSEAVRQRPRGRGLSGGAQPERRHSRISVNWALVLEVYRGTPRRPLGAGPGDGSGILRELMNDEGDCPRAVRI